MARPRVVVTHTWHLDVPEDQVDEDFDLIANAGVSMMERHMVRLNPKIEEGLSSTWHLVWIEGGEEVPEPRGGDMFPDDPTATEVAEELRNRRIEAERRAEAVRRAEWDAAHGPLTPPDRDEQSHGLGEIEAVSDEDVEVDE